MIAKAKRVDPGSLFPSNDSERTVTREIKNILSIGGAVILLLALVSHHASDPSWTTWSTSSQVRNWIGRSGSVVSDLLFQLFGLSAFFFPFALCARGVLRRIVARHAFLLTLSLAVSTAVFLESLLSGIGMPLGIETAGGVVGVALARIGRYSLGTVGTTLISAIVSLVVTMAIFDWRILETLAESRARWKSGLPRRMLDALARLYSGWVALKALVKWRRKPSYPVAPAVASFPPTNENASGAPGGSAPALSFIEGQRDEDFASTTKAPPSKKKAPRMPVAAKEFALPSPAMLSGKSARRGKTVDKQWYIDKGNLLVEKLNDFGVEGEIVNVAPGPVITVYEFKPASGIKIREIANLSDDLTLALSVLSVRIVAPIPGKPVVGIEIPTPQRETVYFKDIVEETNFYKSDRRIPIALGRLASGEPILTDLAAMPHLLVAGATGTGKSVFVNTLICSLLFRFAPQQLKLILVDPKMVELSHYEGIPHLLLPPVVDAKKAVLALRWLVDEMERRYKILHEFGVRHIDAYNARLNELHQQDLYLENEFLPYIVTVIDEYADLMAVVAKDVEHSVARLAQKARASGIHLVLATQRPSTDVVTGTIKANFPSRISFRVASSVDSKTILDRTGAERLLGNGDMLFHSAGFTTLKRMQGSFIEDQDIEKIIDHLKQQAPPEYNEAILEDLENADMEAEALGDDSDAGPLYREAVKLVTERGEASISLIQRHLKIGYNRAATLMEQLERDGVVSQSTGTSKRRAVLVT